MQVNNDTSITSALAQTYGASPASAPAPAPGNAAAAQDSVSVTLTGQNLMLTRLYGVTDPKDVPPREFQLTLYNDTKDSIYWLTRDDQKTLANIYSWADSQGIDLKYVDNLARDIGYYRKFEPYSVSYNGGTFDWEGHQLTAVFTDKDAATASRILNSPAISSSALDQDFLRYATDPGRTLGHLDLDFIEAVVNHFGSADPPPLPPGKFASFQYVPKNNIVIYASEEVVLPPSDPDHINIDGKFYITETGYKHGFRLINGQPVQLTPGQLYLESLALNGEDSKSALLKTLLAPMTPTINAAEYFAAMKAKHDASIPESERPPAPLVGTPPDRSKA
jgi:hypothetical protein